jgi:UDP-N-acetyl-2-amino-2-deoxyglucuronate dehydrogenase
LFRIGIIGCGRVSAAYADSFASMKESVKVCYCVDTRIERAQSFAAQFAGCGYSDKLVDLLYQPLDAVHVLTPHFLHHDHVIACLRAGFHVLTEKPIAIDPDDGRHMIDTSIACGRQLGVVFQNRYITGVREIRRLIGQGAFGEIRGAWSQLNWWRPPSYYECDWKGTWAREGGGVVIDQAIHSLDLVRFLTGLPVRSVQAHIDTRILTGIEVEDVADAAIVLENGAVYSFFASNYYTCNSPIRIEISGEKGRALLTGDRVTVNLDGEAERVIPMEATGVSDGEDYWGSCHLLMLRDFYRALAAGEPAPVDPEDALRTLQLVQAIYRSSRENTKIMMS